MNAALWVIAWAGLTGRFSDWIDRQILNLDRRR